MPSRHASRLRRALPCVLALSSGLAAAGAANAQTDEAAGDDATELAPIRVEDRLDTAWDPVDGYIADRAATATKPDVPLIEVPQSISVISREQLEDRGADTLTEAVAYTPGIRVQNSPAARVIDSFSIEIRGFSAQNATYRDGTQIQAGLPYDAPLETYGLERIEVLRGPASVLYGQGQPGGIINLVTKRPTSAPLREVGLEVGEYDHKQLTADFSDSLDADGEWRYRLTGLWQESDTYIDFVNDDRVYLAPALTWAPSSRTELTLLAHYQENETRYPWSAFPRVGTVEESQFGRIPDSRYIGEPSFDRYDSTVWAVGYLFEHHFDDRWTFRQNLRYRDIEYDVLDTFRNYFGPALSPDYRTLINRFNRARYDEGETTTLDNQLVSTWTHGTVEHTVLVGLDHKTLTYESRDSGFEQIMGPGSDLDLYDPVYGKPFSRPSTFSRRKVEADQTGLYFQDHIKVGERWAFSVGGRQDWVEEDNSGQSEEDQDELSLRAGAVYLADGGWAPYASYSESFTPNYGQNSATGEDYEPITGEQYEVGLRYRPPETGLSMTLALFEITRQNELVAEPGNPTVQIQIGETRSRGAELEVIADLTNNLKAIAAYTYQDVEIVEDGNGANDGNQVGDKPQNLASLWLDYSVATGRLAGLGVGAGVRYTDGYYVSSANDYEDPSTTLVDAAVRYDVDRHVRLQVSASNLLDEQEIYCGGGDPDDFCEYGVPRQVIGSIRYRWD